MRIHVQADNVFAKNVTVNHKIIQKGAAPDNISHTKETVQVHSILIQVT